MKSLIFGVLCILSIRVVAAEDSCFITKTFWSASDEERFSDFVRGFGFADCKTVDDCLRDPRVNPYAGSDTNTRRFFADCADWPYALRAYFACKNGLPFSHVSSSVAIGSTRDTRYSPKGNTVGEIRQWIDATGEGYLLRSLRGTSQIGVWDYISNQVSTAMFRMPPELEIQDFYPIDIDREFLRAGTVLYDPAGHAALVYDVEDTGRVLYIDGHPDNSLTRKAYGRDFNRSREAHGWGFKNFRPQRLEDARYVNGRYIGGRIVRESNRSKLPGFSLVQFRGTEGQPEGTALSEIVFRTENGVVDFHDYVRTRLAKGELKYDPVREISQRVDQLCLDLTDRATSVQLAIDAQIHRKPQPGRLPSNIYGTHGEWETYSTPSRDARLRTSFHELKTEALKIIALYEAGHPSVVYSGGDIKRDMLRAYTEAAQRCEISYINSQQVEVRLGFETVVERLFDLSFDPYHCIELRWGAPEGSREASTCPYDPIKQRWYEAEDILRNQLDRTYEAKMDFTLSELESVTKIGGLPVVSDPPRVDIYEALGYQ